MRATIQFIQPDRKLAILTKLLGIIQGIGSLRPHILAHGVLLDKLNKNDLEILKKALTNLGYSSYIATDSTIRLLIANGELRTLFGLVMPIGRRQNAFAEIFWERGFTIENLPPDQAEDLKKRLETIATVITAPDIPQPSIHTVCGQVSQADGTPISTVGFTVRAFDALSPTNLVPRGNTVALQTNGNYRIDFAWQSDGRKGPNLLVHVFDPQGNIVAEGRKTSAAIQEFLDITVHHFEPETYALTITVKNHATDASLPRVQVDAVFQINGQQLIRSGTTDAEGMTLIPVDESFFGIGHTVEVLFRVHQDDQALDTDTFIENLLPGNQAVEILVTVPKAEGELRIVRGAVRQTDGFPLPDVIVQAFDRDMRTETLLGQAVADTQGFYEIAYTTGQLRRPEKARADLVIRAFEPEGKGMGGEIAVSGIIFNASPQQTVDLEVELEKFRGPSEYERYLAELQPLIESVPTRELTKEDLHFLGGKTGISPKQLNYLRLDAQWSFQYMLLPAVPYALFRQGLPPDLRRLLMEKPLRLQEALKASLAQNIVPAAITPQIDQVIEQLLSLDDSLGFELELELEAEARQGAVSGG
ncbi:hypothetical protein [Nitrosospira sp. Nsp1]|uniref:hypothetical protein n=1 Tax=Nitrosospira sp. Nsp1 TaxID=136547 RepID=UPI0008851CC1|nr:hypothetical protein [Nitrosospira sp. Nsp1]SCX45915.1 hypothetical protein SAMN05720354_10640 [Nitrosospira sp. Nsp1]